MGIYRLIVIALLLSACGGFPTQPVIVNVEKEKPQENRPANVQDKQEDKVDSGVEVVDPEIILAEQEHSGSSADEDLREEASPEPESFQDSGEGEVDSENLSESDSQIISEAEMPTDEEIKKVIEDLDKWLKTE